MPSRSGNRGAAVSGVILSQAAATAGDATVARVATQGRVILERLQPEIDGGRFPIKRTPGESVRVTLDMFSDGHDLLAGVLKYRFVSPGPWIEIPLVDTGDDTWTACFTVSELGE